jgi:CRP-like cAMP-binding protein
MYSSLLDSVQKRTALSETELRYCVDFFVVKRYRKRQYIIQEHQHDNNSYFVVEGLARIYEIDDNGVEHILQFVPNNEWILSLMGNSLQTAARINVDCLEDTTVLVLTASKKQEMLQSIPAMHYFFQGELEANYLKLLRRISGHLSKTSLEQYYSFLEDHSDLEQRVANHFIASYLGIAAQSLSRIRNQGRILAA